MQTQFTTHLSGAETGPTGIVVPPENLAELGTRKNPPVKVTVNGYTYQSTVAVVGGQFMVSFSAAQRKATGLNAGDPIKVTLELDLEPRTVEVPEVLRQALEQRGLQDRFDLLAPSKRKEMVRQIQEARTGETRQRRLEKMLATLSENGASSPQEKTP